MILATISVDEFEGNANLEDVTMLELDNKLSLLRPEQYENVKLDIEEMHRETLASP